MGVVWTGRCAGMWGVWVLTRACLVDALWGHHCRAVIVSEGCGVLHQLQCPASSPQACPTLLAGPLPPPPRHPAKTHAPHHPTQTICLGCQKRNQTATHLPASSISITSLHRQHKTTLYRSDRALVGFNLLSPTHPPAGQHLHHILDGLERSIQPMTKIKIHPLSGSTLC